jgi:hypothetical protein
MSPKIHADLFTRFVESKYLPDEIECGKAHPSEDGEALPHSFLPKLCWLTIQRKMRSSFA